MTSSVIGIDTTTHQKVEIPKPSRLQGLYIIGAPGTGKTGLIENLIIQDIEQDIGVCLLDPHGDLTQAILARMPDRRVKDVTLLDIAEYHYPFGLNLFACSDLTNPFEVQKIIDQVRHIFEKLLGVSTDTPLILQYLLNCTYTLIANPGYTMADIPLLLTDKNCRQRLVANVKRLQVRSFWRDYENKLPSQQLEERSSILRRVEEFLQDLTSSIVGQAQSTIDMRSVMDERKILLVKLSAELPSMTSLIGSIIIALFLNAAYSRADLPIEKRKQFNIYADEFQRFATEDFAVLFTEARKFGIALTVAHQMRDQLDRQNKGATLNVANLVVFKVSSPDADVLAGQFDTSPVATETRKEPVLAINNDPVGWFQQGHGHRNPRIVELVKKYVRPIFDELEKKDPSSSFWIQCIQEDIKVMNSFLVQAMEGIPILPDLAEKLFLSFVGNFTQYLTQYLDKPMHLFFKPYSFQDVNFGEITGRVLYPYSLLYSLLIPNFPDFSRLGISLKREDIRHLFYLPLQDIPPTREEGVKAVEAFVPAYLLNGNYPLKEGEELYEICVKTWLRCFFLCGLYQVPGIVATESEKSLNRTLKYFSDRKSEEISKEDKRVRGILYRHGEYEKHMKFFQDMSTFRYAKFSSDDAISNFVESFRELSTNPILIDRAKHASKLAKEDMGLLTTFIHEWIELAKLLAADPIMKETGQYEEKPVPRTFADMQGEIANELVKLDQHTARVKIAADGKSVEHTIKTLSPTKGLSGKALQERIANIQAQNLQDGYVRNQAEVEEEIIRRQEQCSNLPGSPALLEQSSEPPGSPSSQSRLFLMTG